jgi:hypothetical protein
VQEDGGIEVGVSVEGILKGLDGATRDQDGGVWKLGGGDAALMRYEYNVSLENIEIWVLSKLNRLIGN